MGTRQRLRRTFALAGTLWTFLAITLTISFRPGIIANVVVAATGDVGPDVRNKGEGETECLQYKDDIFMLACSFTWDDHYNIDDYILLQANEIFNGNDFEIDLQGLNFWEGLFQIDSAVDDNTAPVIKHVHVMNGQTSFTGGFIVQSDQNNFVVDSCSSSGTISGASSGDYRGGGGICGQQCSGVILLINCWSTGPIEGRSAGGIAGRALAVAGGQAKIINCWSEGGISGQYSGGICGARAGENEGDVTITKSYSKGDVKGADSGGICGVSAGAGNGHVKICQCFTLGDISGDGSGGITGYRAGCDDGLVEITDCYARGDITGNAHTGGICGRDTGQDLGVVRIENVYASGIKGANRGGIIGSVYSNAKEVKITMSVYNGGSLIGSGSVTEASGNSNDLIDIRGKISCHPEGICWDTTTIWKETDALPMLQAQISPSASVTSTPTSTRLQLEHPLERLQRAQPHH